MYIVCAPSKSATTSFFKLLTQQNKFPVIQTHDLWHFNIHDVPNGQFISHLRVNFEDCVKTVAYFDEAIQWGSGHFDTCLLTLTGDHHQRFFELIKSYKPKFLFPLRDPYQRSVSAFLHWCQYKQILNEMKSTSKCQNPLHFLTQYHGDHDPIDDMKFDLMIKMVKIVKTNCKLLQLEDLAELYEEYFFKPNKLMSEYIHIDIMLERHFPEENVLKFKINCFDKNVILKILDIPLDVQIPVERDKTKVKYIFDHDVEDVFECLYGISQHISLSDSDKEMIHKLGFPMKHEPEQTV